MILVTGGTGYIGSHTVVQLIEAGHDVVIIDNLSNSKLDVLDKIQEITGVRPLFYHIDLLNMDDVERVFNQNEIKAVIHFAGFKAVGESVQIPMAYYQNNITGTLNLCMIMDKYKCKNIVFSSSATVYGLNNISPLTEDLPLSATNPYGQTKLMIENILKDIYVSDDEWSISLLRYFNPIGAHHSSLLGENPRGIPNNLVPYIAQVAEGSLEKLKVFGDDYDTIDGTGVRDYIHVEDLARGHILALNYVFKHKGVEAINLGTGNGSSVLEVIKAYEKECGKAIPYEIVARRAGDVDICFANPQKAKDLLKWEATKTLDEMCRDSWNFMVTTRKS
ncbi:UDP-glucose 4-epimerase GalE [Candidatus Epulonipiscium fishelsonii]|uniref:UDP-glucose 4-epimerase GalE n=1 Tax=Candidatus Epulonipiscium fishelsonii TaxID=77094 RepID=A0ACC8XFL5_9FIRM|nr:UDP-glucose 4-epimerase GalE [Epulopiscium sp. SCG-B05WGA-EpuloA1]ONI42111.1 UDP-glucose 4-epimerase GalE [Epulopiscium sp. SCG-B11WGA-EpuloA1]